MDTCPVYLVAFAKIVLNKNKDIILDGVYFGGLVESIDDAEKLSSDCINNIKGGTILTKIKKLDTPFIIDGMFYVEDKFEAIIKDMREAQSILSK